MSPAVARVRGGRVVRLWVLTQRYLERSSPDARPGVESGTIDGKTNESNIFKVAEQLLSLPFKFEDGSGWMAA